MARDGFGEVRRDVLTGTWGEDRVSVDLAGSAGRSILSISCERTGGFTIRPRGRLDRLLEGRLPAIDFSTGDEPFDGAFVVETRNVDLTADVLDDAETRAAIAALRERGAAEIVLARTRVAAAVDRLALGVEPDRQRMFDVVDRLRVVKRSVEAATARHDGRMAGRDVMPLLISIGFLITSAASFLAARLAHGRYPVLAPFWVATLSTAAALLPTEVAAASLAVLLRRRTSPGSLVAHLPLGAGITLAFATDASVVFANGWLDRKPREVREVVIQEATEEDSPDGERYYAEVVDVVSGDGQRRFRISREAHEKITPGETRLLVGLRQGALGLPWIEAVQLLAP